MEGMWGSKEGRDEDGASLLPGSVAAGEPLISPSCSDFP